MLSPPLGYELTDLYLQPRPQGFSLKKWVRRPTHFLREKPWGRGCFTSMIPCEVSGRKATRGAR